MRGMLRGNLKLRGLLLAFSLMSVNAGCAATVITSVPQISAPTYSTVRITWTTNENSTTVIRWGTETGPPYQYTTKSSGTAGNVRAHAWFLSGLKPVTTYHFAACSAGPDGEEVCSADQSFTTTEKGDTNPIPPAEVDVAMPPVSETILTVGTNCDDPTSGLVARWNQANWGDTVVIPVTTVCNGNYTFPAKPADTQVPHRWIVTRSSTASQLPPPGTRLDPSFDKSKLARVQTNRPNILVANTAFLAENCEAGAYAWVLNDPRAFKLQQCRPSASALTIQSGSGAGAPLRIVVPNHGITGSPYVHLEGVTGNTKANGTFQAVVVDSETLQLNYMGFNQWTGNGPFQGGTLRVNSWQTVNYTTAALLPETCTVGDWFLLQGGQAMDRSYRCLEPNAWTRISMRGSSDFVDGAAVDLSANAAHHLRFIGLEVTSVRLPPEPLWLQLSVDPLRRQQGSLFNSLVSQSERNQYIVWDRCWIHGQSDRSRQWLGFVLDGANVAVVDSVISDLFVWSGTEPGSLASEAESTAFFIAKGPGPIRIENNYVEAGGISFYVPSDRCCSALSEPNDGIVRRNTFHVGDEWRFGSTKFAGKKIVVRHLLELKQGRRWLIEGNVFDGTFSTVNQAAAIALTPRADRGYFLVNSITEGIASMNPLFGYCPTDVQIGDWVTVLGSNNPEHETGWRVLNVENDACTLTLEGPGGNSTGGNLQIMTNRRSVTDINVRSNVFKNVASGIVIIGHTDGANQPSVQLETARRISISNNLFQSIDGSRSNSSDTSFYPNGGVGGYSLYASLGMEDLHFTNNTVVMSSPGPGFAVEHDNSCARGCNPHAGLIYENNIVHYGASPGLGAISSSGTAFGTAALDALFRSGVDPDWTYRKNVIVSRGALPTQPPLGPYPVGNKTHDLNQNGDFPFVNASAGNYRLRSLYRSIDSCYGRSGDCSTNGSDVGVNFDQLELSLGSGRGTAQTGSRQIRLYASVYDAGFCEAEASSNGFANIVPGSQLGSGRARSFLFDNLTPGTTYEYRARCLHGPIIGGQATTRPVGVDRRFQLKLKPPSWMTETSGINAVILTGLTPTTLTTNATLPCTTGCTLEQPAVDGQPVYYRVDYVRTDNVKLATGSVRVWAP